MSLSHHLRKNSSCVYSIYIYSIMGSFNIIYLYIYIYIYFYLFILLFSVSICLKVLQASIMQCYVGHASLKVKACVWSGFFVSEGLAGGWEFRGRKLNKEGTFVPQNYTITHTTEAL